MLFDYLIVHVALKLAEIDRIEGIEKLATFAPLPLPEYTDKNTARGAKFKIMRLMGRFKNWQFLLSF